MIYPANLEKGFNIGVTASSSGFEGEVDYRRLDSAIGHFQELGYRVVTTPNVRTNYKGRSSDPKTRAKEFLELIKDPDIRVIIAASGGDFLVEMLSHVDFNALKDKPKWVQGFSDTTGLGFTITTNLDIASIYSYNFSSFGMENWHKSLWDNIEILEGKDVTQKSFDKYQEGYYPRITGIEEFVLDRDVEWKSLIPKKNNAGEYDNGGQIELHGRALVGCLDILLNIVGTRFDKTVEFAERYSDDGVLWFLESYSLNSDGMIRGLWQLKEAGWFKHAVGFVFGRPAMYDAQYEISYEEAIKTVLSDLNVPIIIDADIGHASPQFTMINGALASVKSENKKGTISFERR